MVAMLRHRFSLDTPTMATIAVALIGLVVFLIGKTTFID